MLKKILAGSALLLTSVAFAQAPDPSLIEKYKKDAQALGIEGNQALGGGSFDPAKAGISPGLGGVLGDKSVQDTKDLFGVTGVELSGTVGKGKKASYGGFLETTLSKGFNCNQPKTVQIGEVLLDIQACNAELTKAVVAVCVTKGGVFCNEGWKKERYEMPLKGSFEWEGVGSVTTQCDPLTKECNTSIKSKAGAVVHETTMNQQGVAAVDKQGTNSVLGATNASSAEYNRQLQTTATEMAGCVGEQTVAITAGGEVKTCKAPGSTEPRKSIQLATTQKELSECETKRECTKPLKKVLTFEKMCNRQVPITNYTYTRSIPTKECSLTRTTKTTNACVRTTVTTNGTVTSQSGCAEYEEGGAGFFGCTIASTACNTVTTNPGPGITVDTTQCTNTYTCYDKNDSSLVTNSCSGTELKDEITVESGESSSCASTASGGGGSGCISWTNYHAFPGKGTIFEDSQKYTPSMISGSPASSCAYRGAGYYSQCKKWYRRTGAEGACYYNQIDRDGITPTTTFGDLTYEDNPGCGFCIEPIMSDVCYANASAADPADNCDSIPDTCKLVSNTCSAAENGMCLGQTEVYSCEKEEDSCGEWTTSTNSCLSTNAALGLEKQKVAKPSGDNGLSKALIDMGIASSIMQSVEEGQSLALPKIFKGDDMRCRKPKNSLFTVGFNDCCKESLERPGGDKPFHQCTMPEVKLAAARRSSRSVYLGDYCSKKVKLGFVKKCIEDTQTYCTFSGILPKLVQIQGRAQLANLAASSVSATTQTIATSVPFYAETKGWSNPVALNGNQIHQWIWPKICSDAKALAEGGLEEMCPTTLETWFAVCSKPGGCGPLPDHPYSDSDTWGITLADPLSNKTTAISQYAVATGACSPSSGMCSYSLSAYPAGVGGKAVLTKVLEWPLYSDEDHDPASVKGGVMPAGMLNIGDTVFKPYSFSGVQAGIPASVNIDYSTNGGQTWQRTSISTNITGTETTLPNTDMKISGSCDKNTLLCSYRITGSVSVTAKPWGSPKNPDCSGFTIGQLSVLDFSKMDLSEWIQSITKTISSKMGTNEQMAEKAKAQTQAFYNAMSTGTPIEVDDPVSKRAIFVSPREEYGPFNVTLTATGNYPYWSDDPAENNDPVSGATVEWGDCSGATRMDMASTTGQGYAFQANHTYPSPAKHEGGICGTGNKNFNHEIVVTLHAKSGDHKVRTWVKNIYKNFEGTVGHEEGPGGLVSKKRQVILPR